MKKFQTYRGSHEAVRYRNPDHALEIRGSGVRLYQHSYSSMICCTRYARIRVVQIPGTGITISGGVFLPRWIVDFHSVPHFRSCHTIAWITLATHPGEIEKRSLLRWPSFGMIRPKKKRKEILVKKVAACVANVFRQ
ncbi:unnamed protein product [Tuber aestivum]|uniref:Uncharacterized protein n=1 Tax=Tuber aestivum TaxID=59557 RepID=A0A292Q1U9_9PEZI|nr:unnamed protein product [Tuber aestivum]